MERVQRPRESILIPCPPFSRDVHWVHHLGHSGVHGPRPPHTRTAIHPVLTARAFTHSSPPAALLPLRSYVKVAQALSTRVDLLSPAYFAQVQLLQDRVPPFPCEVAKAEMDKAGMEGRRGRLGIGRDRPWGTRRG